MVVLWLPDVCHATCTAQEERRRGGRKGGGEREGEEEGRGGGGTAGASTAQSRLGSTGLKPLHSGSRGKRIRNSRLLCEFKARLAYVRMSKLLKTETKHWGIPVGGNGSPGALLS